MVNDSTSERIQSVGGVTLEVPAGWVSMFDDEHLSALVDPTTGAAVMAPTCIVNDAPGHVDLPSWWSALQVGSDGALLLEVEECDDGFAATYALVADELSSTGHARIYHLPGRTLVVTVSFESASTAELLPTAKGIAGSAQVEGLP